MINVTFPPEKKGFYKADILFLFFLVLSNL